MKTLLNLLPEGKKDAIQKHLLLRFLLWQFFLLFLLEVFYMAILISIFLILDLQVKGQQSTGSTVTVNRSDEQRLNDYQRTFKETNALVDVIGKIDRSHVYFSKLFPLLDTLLPPGVTLEQLATDDFAVTLLGKAAKREDLLLLDDRLKGASDCISDIDLPVSNLFSQENINFKVVFSITPACLKNN